MQTHRDIEFGDGVYTFRLTMAGILAIEEKAGAKIGRVYADVLTGRYEKDGAAFGYGLQATFGLREVLEICRQGLIGGNSGFVDGRDIKVSDHLATHLVRTYLEPDAGNPLLKAWDLATVILETCISGYTPAAVEAPKEPKRETGDGRLDRGQIIGNGVIMGLSPEQTLAMPMHDYEASLHHYAKAQGDDEDDGEALSPGDFDAMLGGLASAGLH